MAGLLPPPLSPARMSVLGVVCLAGCSEFRVFGQYEEVQDALVVEERFVQASLPAADVLWVIDDTASMADEHVALADAFDAFAAALDGFGVAWQVGVVTTDISAADAGLLQGDPWILTPDTPDRAAALAQMLDVGTDGASPEAGLGAAVLALSDPLRSEANRAFRRADASLHVVVVSDSDDSSEDVLGEDPAGAFEDFLAAEAASSGQSATLSAVVGDVPAGCTWEGGTALPGTRYAAIAQATGGVVSTICAADLSAVIAALGDVSVSWPVRFELQSEPVADTVRVSVDGQRQDGGWTLELDPAAIVFDVAPAPDAEIDVRYEVAQ